MPKRMQQKQALPHHKCLTFRKFLLVKQILFGMKNNDCFMDNTVFNAIDKKNSNKS